MAFIALGHTLAIEHLAINLGCSYLSNVQSPENGHLEVNVTIQTSEAETTTAPPEWLAAFPLGY